MKYSDSIYRTILGDKILNEVADSDTDLLQKVIQ